MSTHCRAIAGPSTGPTVRTFGPRLGALPFTVFVKGRGFSSMGNPQCAKKGRIGIGRWEKRMEGKKTRTLERHKGAAPKVQSAQMRAHPPVAQGSPNLFFKSSTDF